MLLMISAFAKSQDNHWFVHSIELIKSQHVGHLDTTELVPLVLSNLMQGLDPYSEFLTDSMHRQRLSMLHGKFAGLMLEPVFLDENLFIWNDPEGMIPPGSRVKMINGTEPVVTKKPEGLFTAEEGTGFDLLLCFPGTERDSLLHVKAKNHPRSTVHSLLLPEEGVAYFKVDFFSRKTAHEMDNLLMEAREQKIGNYILDLRSNPGGLIETAADLCGKFLSKGRLIVTVKKNNGESMRFSNQDEPTCPDGKVVVLTDSLTASAAEVVAVALQEQKRALIAGQRTFGKGLVQYPFAISPHGYLYLSVAAYYSPQGHCLQKGFESALLRFDAAEGGVMPDYPFDNEVMQLTGRMRHEHIFRKALINWLGHGRKAGQAAGMQQPDDSVLYALLAEIPQYALASGIDLNFQNPALRQNMINQFRIIWAEMFAEKAEVLKLKFRSDPLIGYALELLHSEKPFVLHAVSY